MVRHPEEYFDCLVSFTQSNAFIMKQIEYVIGSKVMT